MYKVINTKRFRKALKKCLKRGLDINKFKGIVEVLTSTGTVPERCKPHKLSAKFNYAWECHIEPDWLLVWEQHDDELILIFSRALKRPRYRFVG